MSEFSRHWTKSVEIFAAACSGCDLLSQEFDIPCVCVRASVDADASIEAMNSDSYGGARLWVDGFQPFDSNFGWRDWRILPLADVVSGPHDNFCVAGNRICIDLPTHVTTAGFEAGLHATLRRFRVEEIATSPQWLIARSEALRPLLWTPRYTLVDQTNFKGGATRVDDLFALEPHRRGAILIEALRPIACALQAPERTARDAT